jgi:hypothetical protein
MVDHRIAQLRRLQITAMARMVESRRPRKRPVSDVVLISEFLPSLAALM